MQNIIVNSKILNNNVYTILINSKKSHFKIEMHNLKTGIFILLHYMQNRKWKNLEIFVCKLKQLILIGFFF